MIFEILILFNSNLVWEPEPQDLDEEAIRIKEQGILQLGELYKTEKKAKGQ
jgi:hypothetical protein